ncbi:hypothetical protein [Actinomycetospora aeridis]|uniref:Uncharacterized protein n=1 Tax=Actinomycetospora aeridis TaxID=3129231 RepID=A0ABU8N1A2_9PSEU
MLPRPVAVAIVIALTLLEGVNIIGQVFLGTGDTAIHVMYPAVLGALGLTTKRAEPDTAAPEPAEPSEPDTDPLEARTSRHRRDGRQGPR